MAGRNAHELSMRSYGYKLRRAQELLARAGFDHGDGTTPAEQFPWHLVTVADAAAYRKLVLASYSSPKSAQNLLGVVRAMVQLCTRAQLLTPAQRDDLIEELPLPASAPRRCGRSLDPDELTRLIDAAQQADEVLAARDTALLATFMGTGGRITEVMDLEVRDLDLDEACVVFRRTKGGGSRVAWLPGGTVDALATWLKVRGDAPGHLFDREGEPRFTHSGARQRLARLERIAGVRHFSPHDFRRTYITTLLRTGTDPFLVARAVGHKNVNTTLLYDRRTDEEDRDAVNRLDIPTRIRGSAREDEA